MGKTLFEKIWDSHVIAQDEGAPAVLYIDAHLVHEVTSPQAFDTLRARGLPVRRPDKTFATMDHAIPTRIGAVEVDWPEDAATQVRALRQNCADFDVPLYDIEGDIQGIVHVIGPELGVTQPGMTIVCGDSHTSTHGAFGALAFGIGTSEVGYVLATQCLMQAQAKTFAINVEGSLGLGITAKDIILAIIAKNGAGGGAGHVFEYRGPAIRALDMASRMTICNMSIEGGARAGMIAPDETTFNYINGRQFAPKGEEFEKAVDEWRKLPTDAGATFDRLVEIDAASLEPFVTWGTNPGMVARVSDRVPDPNSFSDQAQREAAERALTYMDLEPDTPISDIKLDRVFIGACTNSRLEDLRAAAEVVKGRKVHPDVYAMVVPGSALIKAQAEAEGLDRIFTDAGLDWRVAGCSMCLGMNPDILAPGERCASTSNRNFEGRQGKGGRTHLVSPPMAAAAAITGHFVDIREW